jgi:hypothetical protein
MSYTRRVNLLAAPPYLVSVYMHLAMPVRFMALPGQYRCPSK